MPTGLDGPVAMEEVGEIPEDAIAAVAVSKRVAEDPPSSAADADGQDGRHEGSSAGAAG